MNFSFKSACRVVKEELDSLELVWASLAVSLYPSPLFQGLRAPKRGYPKLMRLGTFPRPFRFLES